ncbi:uroporphyrinogen-III synthase [Nitrosopumilus sp. b1]|uniref:uroporphyrinogen-III synthase n=1 Tax=Nitrosopumilus sp. b1 TaxID=2109907 RepID=UPI0015F6DE6D|nr:uroporphyrinogen-III synthase [Nitrosopumilus sp. b1]KAF6242483.1 uroporphyrinogen-III synthase [Nitrosopumilus sp. b1]
MIEGKTIAITRSKEDSSEFISLMQENKATPITLPTIQLVSKGEKIVDEFLNTIKEYDPDYSVFMSSKAVTLLFDTAKKISKLEKLQLAIANTIVIAVGPKTKQVLESEGIKVNHTPKRFSSVGVGEVFTRLNAVGKKVIVPRSGASTPFLKDLLEKIGLDVKELYLYDVCAFQDTTQWNEFRELFSKNNVDGIVFTSASSVRAFFEIMTSDLPKEKLLKSLEKTHVVAIGPFTADELKKFNVQNSIAEVHTIPGAFDTIKNIFSVA